MNSLFSEHHTEETLEAKPVWADSQPPSADPELSLQDAALTRLRVTAAPPTARAESSSLVSVAHGYKSLERVHSSTVTDAVNIFQVSWSH